MVLSLFLKLSPFLVVAKLLFDMIIRSIACAGNCNSSCNQECSWDVLLKADFVHKL